MNKSLQPILSFPEGRGMKKIKAEMKFYFLCNRHLFFMATSLRRTLVLNIFIQLLSKRILKIPAKIYEPKRIELPNHRVPSPWYKGWGEA
jgi:hypothetical protein